MAGLEAMISSMEKKLGMGEPNAVQSWYKSRNGSAYAGNFAWCDALITWASVDSGNHDTVCFGTDYAYTVAHADKFSSKGQWTAMTKGIAASGIRRGDIVFFDWDGSSSIGAIDHVGIVTSVSGGNVYTIEGNTSNVCARRVRAVHDVAGFGRPAYSKSPSAPPVSGPARYTNTINGLAYGYGAKGDQVTKVGKALVAKGFGKHYKDGPGPTWSDADTECYSDYQKSLGLKGTAPGQDADGVPGASTLKKLLGSLPSKPAAKPVYEPFPGTAFFHTGRTSPIITAMGRRLVAEGCSKYSSGPGPNWTNSDKKSFAAWQTKYSKAHKLGWSAADCDGIPGKESWDALHVLAAL
ncbi:peptidoglycan-binding protein [Streptomyces sp. NPDC090052]|uniref:peptidoglycan-binding protein n=1 Tax=Streptomyces sp. NPDC090052 TaxID=3365931 RepID=UPI003807AA95